MSARESLVRIRRIVAVPLQARLGQGHVGSLRFTVGFALFIPALLLVASFWIPQVFVAAVGAWLGLGGLLTLGWWATFLASLETQSRWAGAALVPGHARHLGLALWATAGVITLVFGGGWGVLTHWPCTAMVATLGLLALVALAMRVRFGVLIALALVSAGGKLVERLSSEASFQATTPFERAGALGLALLVALAILAVATPRARRAGKVVVRSVDVQRADMLARAAPVAIPTLDPRWLRRDGASRVLSVLPLGHGADIAALQAILFWPLLALVAAYLPPALVVDRGPVALCILDLVVMWRFVDKACAPAVGLSATARSQPLLALLPGVPRGAAFARTMASRLTRRLLVQLVSSVIGLANLRLMLDKCGAPTPWWSSFDAIAALLVTCVPLVAFAWRDWARARPPGSLQVLGRVMVPMAVWGLAMFLREQEGLSLAVDVAASVVATSAWCAWRWRRMAREPFPLPFGRLA